MLTNVRGNLDSIFVKVLLGLLVAAFAVWGIGPTMFAGNTNIVANVGDEEIQRIDYELAVRRQARNVQATYQIPQSESEIIRNFGLAQRVLAEMMIDAAYQVNAKDLGMRISKEAIAEELQKIEAFQMGGVFSKQAMESYLQSAQITYKELEENIALTLLRRQLTETLVAQKPSSSKMAELLYAYDNERRDATIITITRSDAGDIAPITDEDLTAAYEKGKSGYMTPERRSYDYVLLSPEAYKGGLTVTDEEIKTLYDSKAADYIKKESRTFNHISFPSEAEAKDFIAKVSAGAGFVETAAAMTEFSAAEISIGSFTEEKLTESYSEEAAKAAFALNKDALSAPVKSLAGFDVYQVTEITAGQTTELAEVTDTLRDEILTNKATKAMYDATNTIDNDIASGISFAELVEKYSLTVAKVDAVNQSGMGADEKPQISTREGATILRQAFNLEIGEDPELFDIDETDAAKGMYLVNVSKVDAPRQKTLDEMRGSLTTELENTRKLEKAGELAEKAMARLAEGVDPVKVIEEFGGTSFAAKRIARKVEPKSTLDQNIRDLLFSLNVNEMDIERTADNTGYVVVRNDIIRKADLIADAEKLKTFKAGLSDQLASDILQQYQANLFKRYEVTENRTLIQSLFQPVDQ